MFKKKEIWQKASSSRRKFTSELLLLCIERVHLKLFRDPIKISPAGHLTLEISGPIVLLVTVFVEGELHFWPENFFKFTWRDWSVTGLISDGWNQWSGRNIKSYQNYLNTHFIIESQIRNSSFNFW